jgi:hypothetical protein
MGDVVIEMGLPHPGSPAHRISGDAGNFLSASWASPVGPWRAVGLDRFLDGPSGGDQLVDADGAEVVAFGAGAVRFGPHDGIWNDEFVVAGLLGPGDLDVEIEVGHRRSRACPARSTPSSRRCWCRSTSPDRRRRRLGGAGHCALQFGESLADGGRVRRNDRGR